MGSATLSGAAEASEAAFSAAAAAGSVVDLMVGLAVATRTLMATVVDVVAENADVWAWAGSVSAAKARVGHEVVRVRAGEATAMVVVDTRVGEEAMVREVEATETVEVDTMQLEVVATSAAQCEEVKAH